MKTPPTARIDTELLVVGFGHPQRQDDGAGPRVAERIAALHLPGVRTLIGEQLAPEHAAPLAHARVAVFVHAVVGAPRHVRLNPIRPGATPLGPAQAADLPAMLAAARDLHGHAPQAWRAPIPAVRTGVGPELSVTARRGIDAATQTVRRFAQLAGGGRDSTLRSRPGIALSAAAHAAHRLSPARLV